MMNGWMESKFQNESSSVVIRYANTKKKQYSDHEWMDQNKSSIIGVRNSKRKFVDSKSTLVSLRVP